MQDSVPTLIPDIPVHFKGVIGYISVGITILTAPPIGMASDRVTSKVNFVVV